jgi:hypothetical protein
MPQNTHRYISPKAALHVLSHSRSSAFAQSHHLFSRGRRAESGKFLADCSASFLAHREIFFLFHTFGMMETGKDALQMGIEKILARSG